MELTVASASKAAAERRKGAIRREAGTQWGPRRGLEVPGISVLRPGSLGVLSTALL